jgi:hypothetical protein
MAVEHLVAAKGAQQNDPPSVATARDLNPAQVIGLLIRGALPGIVVSSTSQTARGAAVVALAENQVPLIYEELDDRPRGGAPIKAGEKPNLGVVQIPQGLVVQVIESASGRDMAWVEEIDDHHPVWTGIGHKDVITFFARIVGEVSLTSEDVPSLPFSQQAEPVQVDHHQLSLPDLPILAQSQAINESQIF